MPHSAVMSRRPWRKPGTGRDQPLHRLDDDARDLVLVGVDHLAGGVEVVVGADEHVVLEMVGDARRVRDAAAGIVGLRRPEAHQAPVAHAVIAALEFEDLRPPPVGAGEPHRIGVRLGPGTGEPDLLGARHGVHDLGREPDAVLVVDEEGRAELDLLAHRRVHLRMRVPDQHGTRAEEVIDIFVAADVPDPAAISPPDDRLARHVAEMATRQDLSGDLDEPVLFGADGLAHLGLRRGVGREVGRGVGKALGQAASAGSGRTGVRCQPSSWRRQ